MQDSGMTVEITGESGRQRGVVLASGTWWALVYLPGSEEHPCPPHTGKSYRIVGPGDMIAGSAQRLDETDPEWLEWSWALVRTTGWGHLGNSAIAREWETAAQVATGTMQPFQSLSPYSIAGRWARARDEQERSYWHEQYSRATGRRGTEATRELRAYRLIHQQGAEPSTDVEGS